MAYNYKVTIEFDGTGYNGWQYQTEDIPTIQREVMRVLAVIAKKKVVVTGSSRTDAGVHSTGLVANFHLHMAIEAASLRRAMNTLLPHDIRIATCEKVDRSFNARFGARQKTYEYRIFRGEFLSPFQTRTFAHIPHPLDTRAMKRAIKHFRGEKDFSSFTSDDPAKNRIRSISRLHMRIRGEEIRFLVTGRSFLRYMVRNIVGTLIDVGRGKIRPGDIPAIFEARDRRRAGRTAAAKGLILREVKY